MLELQKVLYSTLDTVIPSNIRVALLDFPNHRNVGDSAIWLGELSYLARRGVQVAYRSDLRTFMPEHIGQLSADDPILLHGGGNCGDLWPAHQRFREGVLERFPSRRIIQLPQTVHFGSRKALERAKRSFSSHARFTLLVRDSNSLELALNHFDCETILCPDAALALAPLSRPGLPATDIVWLGRRDHEAARHSEPPVALTEGVERVDWIGRGTASRRDTWARLVLRYATPAALRTGLAGHRALRSLWKEWDRLAERRVKVGVAILGRGRVVITDRLHGHIICAMTGNPHVLLEDRFGKVSSFTRTWNSDAGNVRWTATPAQALEAARELLASPP